MASEPALLMRILISESARAHGAALHSAIVGKAKDLGLAGATVWRGIEGYGAGSHIHTASILRLSEDLPVVVEIVDTEDKVRAALPEIERLIVAAGCGGLITLDHTEVIRCAPTMR